MTTATHSAKLPTAFWTYWAGITLTALAYSVVGIALPFLVLAAHPAQPERAVGAVVLAGSLPLFFGPLLGAVADRMAPRRILLVAPVLRALLVAGVGALALRGGVSLPVLLGLAVLNGLLSTLSFTAGGTLLPRLVAPEQLTRANSLRSGALMGAPLVGYGLGGVLVAGLGAGPTLLACAPFIAALSVAAWWLPRLEAAPSAERFNLLGDLRVGLGMVGRSRSLLSMLAVSFTLNVAMNLMNTRSPLFMRDFGRGAPDYAAFEMLISGGVLLGISLVTPLNKKWPLDRLIGAGLWALALASAGFMAVQVPAWWVAGLVFGAGVGLVEVAGTTRSQEVIPAEVRGRVMGALMSVNAFGLVAGAALASRPLSTQALMLGLGAVLLGLALSWKWASGNAASAEVAH